MSLKKFGRYEINSLVGRGGMATVYHAYDPQFERDVALKVLPRKLLHDPGYKERFEREAKAIAAIEHPAIVPVYDYGEEDGQPFLVMRYMTGGSLADRLKNELLSLEEIAEIYQRLAPALDEAHQLGIIHRDIKPANILFDQRDNAHLTDFGFVKLLEIDSSLTGAGIVGTPAYISPEQGRGDSHIDGRSDIYSLGAMLFRLLSGRIPYAAETPAGRIVKHITEPIPDLLEIRPDLPAECQWIIFKAMAKKPERRFETVGEMAELLRQVAQGSTLPTKYMPDPSREEFVSGESTLLLELAAVKRSQRRIRNWLLFGGGILLVILFLAFPGRSFFTTLPWQLTPTYNATLISLQPTPSANPSETPAPNPSPTSDATPTSTLTQNPLLTEPPPKQYVSIAVGAANLRKGPGVNYPILDTYLQDDSLEATGRNKDGTWLMVTGSDGTEGWINIDTLDVQFDIRLLDEVEPPPPPDTPQPTSTPTGLNESNGTLAPTSTKRAGKPTKKPTKTDRP